MGTAESIKLLSQILAAAGEDVQECSICSEPGEFAIDPEHQGSESTLLRPTFCFSVVIAQKLLIPTKCVVHLCLPFFLNYPLQCSA